MKLFLVVFLGAITLGMSPVAVAKSDFVATNLLYARKQLDCPMTCRENRIIKFVMIAGLDQKERKPLSICTTKKGDEWLVGYNRL